MIPIGSQTILVSGATGGIGRSAAASLARSGAHVILLGRDPERTQRTREEIVEQSANPRVEWAVADLSSSASIQSFADSFLKTHPELHGLVNNAGTWSSSRKLTAEGLEQTWATNVLGYHRLTQALLPALKNARQARVVNVASQLARDLDLDDASFERRPWDGVSAYAQSKQADRMWTRALARRLKGTGITANSMHPGGVNTGLFGKGGGIKGLLGGWYMRFFGKTPEQGADTVVWLVAEPSLDGATGGFYIDRTPRRCRFEDEVREEALWALLERSSRS